MKKVLKHIIAYLAAVLIVVATGGIGLVQHYCSCEDDSDLSISQVSTLAHPDEPASCCESKTVTVPEQCCTVPAAEETGQEGHACHAGHGCCSDHYSFYKTDQFDLAGSHSPTFKFHSAYECEISSGESRETSEHQPVTTINDRSPPDDYGISFLIRIHQLKISPLMS